MRQNGKEKGGVAFYVQESLRVSILGQSDNEYAGRPEYIVAGISEGGGSGLLLAVVYRPPHCGYLGVFEDVFMSFQMNYRHSIILATLIPICWSRLRTA